MTETSCVIRLENLSFAYPGSSEKVLNNLNLEIFKGDRIGMMAPTGSGKTTLLHTIMGLCMPDSGTITIFDKSLEAQKDFEGIRTRIGLLFQDSDDQLFCPTVLEDVAFGPLNLGCSRQEAVELAENTLKRLGLTGFEQRITHRLSGGQKRLVALAAVLAMKPEVLLLDEPTTGLDQGVKKTLIHILNELRITCLVISHEFDFINAVTDKIYSMEKGNILTDTNIYLHHHEHLHKHGHHPHVH
jgi:cobalt/nickel transport system ATP-binding protein